MRPYFILFLSFFIFSCSKQPEEIAIIDYVQTIDNAKVELNVDVIELKQTSFITSQDSIDFIDSLMISIANKMKFRIDLDKMNMESKISLKETELKYESNKLMKETKINTLKTYYESLDLYKKILNEIDSGHYDNLNSETMALAKQKAKFTNDPSRKIALVYDCKYKFDNPQMGGARTEIKRLFVLDTLKSKVLIAIN